MGNGSIVSLDEFRADSAKEKKDVAFEGEQITSLMDIGGTFTGALSLDWLNTPDGVVLHFRDSHLPKRSNVIFSVEKIRKTSGVFLYRLMINGAYPPPKRGVGAFVDSYNFDVITGQLTRYLEDYTSADSGVPLRPSNILTLAVGN